MTDLVIPAPDAFGGRVTPQTPLGVLVATLRRHNPRAPFGQLKRAAEQLRQTGLPERAEGLQGPRPDRFDSGTGSEGDAGHEPPSPPEPAVAELPAPSQRKPTRAEVTAWLETLPKRQRPKMSASGRIPAAVLTAYRAAHRDEVLASMVPVENADGSPAEPMPADPPITEVH